MIQLSSQDFLYQLPLLVLIVVGLLLILAESFSSGRQQASLMGLTVAGCIGALVACIFVYRQVGEATVPLMGGMLLADQYAFFFIGLFSAVAAAIALISPGHQREHDWVHGEYYGLLLLATAGMAMLAMAGDLVVVFLGIETMSLAVYVMTGSRRRSRRSTEAALKYFLMGAFATGFLAYGIALIYGAIGSTNLLVIQAQLPLQASNPLLVIGILVLVVAFGFKVAAIPFHMWAPDAYEGAPTPVTGFMAAAVKAAAFAVMLRLFGDIFAGDVMPYGRMGWASSMVVLAALTMTVANIAALRQANIKRMLAYSSISHAGILLTGVVAAGLGAGDEARSAVMYYLLAYSVTTVGAFAVVSWIGSRGHERLAVDDWAGLAQRHPGAALAMTIFMLSMGGLPPTAGFFGKFYLFKAAMQVADQQLLWLVILGVVNSAISIFYYLRVVMTMYFREPDGEFRVERTGAVSLVLIVCALAVIEMGILPGFWLGLTN